MPVTYCPKYFALHRILVFSFLEKDISSCGSEPGQGRGDCHVSNMGSENPTMQSEWAAGRKEGSVFLEAGPLQAAGLEEEPWARQWESLGLLHSSHSVN